MQNSGDYIPPVWIMGQKWKIEYFFEQRMINLTMDVSSTLAQNFVKRSEQWEYQVYGRETIHDQPHIVIRATPVAGVPEELRNCEIQFYFEEQSRTLHGFKRKVSSAAGDPRIEYVKNPWRSQSFFTTNHEHLIMDWPLVEHGRVEKQVGIGSVGFTQKDFFDRQGFIVQLGNSDSTTVLTWQAGKPWWVFADKMLISKDRAIHIQAKLIEEQPKQKPLMGQ